MLKCFEFRIYWRGIVHDMSKFGLNQFLSYARYFYNRDGSSRSKVSELDQLQLNLNWLHHQHRNKHHFQNWILIQDSGREILIQMPQKYVKEMISDWFSAGKVLQRHNYNDFREVRSWYTINKHNIRLHPNTRKYVEKLINYVD